MKTRTTTAGHRVLAIAVLIGGAGLAACESDPVDLHGHEEGDVAGFRIDAINLTLPGGGSRLTLLTYDGPENADTLVLYDDRTIEIEIVWLDEHGDEVELDADEHGWELVENHGAIASFVPSASEPWQGTFTTNDLVPVDTVYGSYTVTLMHGDEPEFSSTTLVAAVQTEG